MRTTEVAPPPKLSTAEAVAERQQWRAHLGLAPPPPPTNESLLLLGPSSEGTQAPRHASGQPLRFGLKAKPKPLGGRIGHATRTTGSMFHCEDDQP